MANDATFRGLGYGPDDNNTPPRPEGIPPGTGEPGDNEDTGSAAQNTPEITIPGTPPMIGDIDREAQKWIDSGAAAEEKHISWRDFKAFRRAMGVTIYQATGAPEECGPDPIAEPAIIEPAPGPGAPIPPARADIGGADGADGDSEGLITSGEIREDIECIGGE